MTDEKDTDLTSAEQAFFVANSPLFLLRKLREDPVVQRIARSNEGRQLLEALKEAAATKPETLRDRAEPFVFLIALAAKNDIVLLREATSIELSSNNDWFDYIRRALIEAYRPTTVTIFDRPHVAALQVSANSTSALSFPPPRVPKQ